MTFRTIALASALIAGSISFAVAQTGGDAAAGGARNSGMAPAQNNQSGVTDPKGTAPTGSMSGNTGTMNNTRSSSSNMAPCPAGMGRASGSNSNGATSPEMGECKKL